MRRSWRIWNSTSVYSHFLSSKLEFSLWISKIKLKKKKNLNHKEIIAHIQEKLPGMVVNFNSGLGLETSQIAPSSNTVRTIILQETINPSTKWPSIKKTLHPPADSVSTLQQQQQQKITFFTQRNF